MFRDSQKLENLVVKLWYKLYCNIHAPNNDFLDPFSSHFFPYILQSTRVTSSFKAVPNIIYVKITASISDYLPQFLVAPYIFLYLPVPKTINMIEIGQNLKKFILDCFWLTGIIFCFHQTLIHHIKPLLKNFNLYSTFLYL